MKDSFPPPGIVRSHLKLAIITVGLCAASMAQAGTLTAVVTDAGGAAVEDAVIALYDGKRVPATSQQATLDQRNKQFDPHVLVVRTHTSVQFPNSDDIHHEVYSFSKTKPFELPLYHRTPAAQVNFDTPGAVVLGCNIHDNMLAYIYVVDSPWYAKTDSTGKLIINELPVGKYRARLWYPGLTETAPTIEQEVIVTANAATAITFNNAQREARAASVPTTRSWSERRAN
ncbi:MAG TPA: methylamine utilization protein [Spongiibacteraceae bacterium]|nr:methylamine utilization protein [Spongiibacteraceae bacterium]